jgi:Ca-activated chloride channel family protein
MDSSYASNGALLVSTSGRTLPLRDITVTSEAAGGIARTVLRQHFTNPHAQTLDLEYQFPLPADGAVAAYQVRAGQRIITGRIAPRDQAQQEFDEARLEGRTAGLVDQERPNFFTQRLGNIPASTDVVVDLTIDHPLAWIAGGTWEWRFPTVIAPRYLGSEGTVPDHRRVTVDVAASDPGARASVTLTLGDDLATAPTSPTHAVVPDRQRVTLAADAALDRDIVIRWAAVEQTPGCTLRSMRPREGAGDAAYGLLTIVPPATVDRAIARDLILLVDVSGSMSGRPLEHLKAVVTTLVETLDDGDRLEMIAFASNARRYKPMAVNATPDERRLACAWIRALEAGGGTELIPAIVEALRPMRHDATRQVVVVTDGQIGFESSAVRAIRDGLPTGSRLHAVGLGSASNRGFIHPAARAGRGVEIVVDLDDTAERSAQRIAAAVREPAVVDVAIEGTALLDAATHLPDLLTGSPVVAPLRLHASGGMLMIRGRTHQGWWEERVTVAPIAPGDGMESIRALWARQAIEDLELDLACGANHKTTDRLIEQLALEHGVASRLTSWIAIAHEPDVDPTDPVRVERIPQALPYGVSTDGFAVGDLPLLQRRQPRSLPAPQGIPGRMWDMVDAVSDFLFRGPASTTLRGRILPTRGGTTSTIEFFLTSDLDWQPGGEARIGTHIFSIVESGTTRRGRIGAGSIVRVELDAAPGNIDRQGELRIACGRTTLIISFDETD